MSTNQVRSLGLLWPWNDDKLENGQKKNTFCVKLPLFSDPITNVDPPFVLRIQDNSCNQVRLKNRLTFVLDSTIIIGVPYFF